MHRSSSFWEYSVVPYLTDVCQEFPKNECKKCITKPILKITELIQTASTVFYHIYSMYTAKTFTFIIALCLKHRCTNGYAETFDKPAYGIQENKECKYDVALLRNSCWYGHNCIFLQLLNNIWCYIMNITESNRNTALQTPMPLPEAYKSPAVISHCFTW